MNKLIDKNNNEVSRERLIAKIKEACLREENWLDGGCMNWNFVAADVWIELAVNDDPSEIIENALGFVDNIICAVGIEKLAA